MPDWEFNVNTKQGTLWIKRGAPVDRTSVVNTNTVSWGQDGEMISVVFPNPLATMNLAGLTFKNAEDHDHCRELMKHFNVKTGG